MQNVSVALRVALFFSALIAGASIIRNSNISIPIMSRLPEEYKTAIAAGKNAVSCLINFRYQDIAYQQNQELLAIKRITAKYISMGEFPNLNSKIIMDNVLIREIDSASLNPYTGLKRTWGNRGNGVYYGCNVNTNKRTAILYSPLQKPCTAIGSVPEVQPSDPDNLMGGFLFIYDTVSEAKFRVIFADGKKALYDGWAFVETDMAGNITAAIGGGIADGYLMNDTDSGETTGGYITYGLCIQ